MRLGGKGLLPGRDADWGAGFYTIGMSDEDLLVRLPVDDELGGQAYYDIAVSRPRIYLYYTRCAGDRLGFGA